MHKEIIEEMLNECRSIEEQRAIVELARRLGLTPHYQAVTFSYAAEVKKERTRANNITWHVANGGLI